MRKASSSFLMKIFLGLVVLAVGLGMGITSFFSSDPHKKPVTYIGDTVITTQDFLVDLENKKEHLKKVFGRPVTNKEAQAFGIVNRSLSELVTKKLLDNETDRIGIYASDSQLVKQVQSDPNFFEGSGSFSQEKFQQFLYKIGLTEKAFFDDIRKQMDRAAITQAINSNLIRMPKVMQETYFNYLNQKRDIEVITIHIENIADLPAPSEEVLRKFYDEHKNIAQAAETRSFDSLIFNFEKVASKIKVTDQELQDVYKAQKNEIPESRDIRALAFPNREMAEKAYKDLNSGVHFENVYSRYFTDRPENAPKAQTLAMNQVRKDIASELFSIQNVRGTTKPLLLSGQFVVFYVEKITAAKTLTFEEQRFNILKKVKTNLARERLHEMTQKAEEGLRAGQTLVEIASTLAETYGSEIDFASYQNVGQNGFTINQQRLSGLPLDAKFLATVFEIFDNDHSDVTQLQDGSYFIVAVKEIKAAHQRTFEDALPVITMAWQYEQKRAKALEMAKQIEQDLKESKSLFSIASKYSVEADTLKSITRIEAKENQDLQLFLSKLTDKNKGDTLVLPDMGVVRIGKIENITNPTKNEMKDGLAAFSDNYLKPVVENDVLSSYIASLREYFPVRNNEEFFEKFFEKM